MTDEVHSAHSAHAAAHRHCRLVLGIDRRFGGDQQAGDRGRVLQCGANDLGRVDYAGVDKVFIDLGLGVEAHILVLALKQLARDHRAVMTGVLRDLADRRIERLADDIDPAGLVIIDALEAFQGLGGVEQSDTAARDDAFFDRGAGRVEGVVTRILRLIQSRTRRRPDHGNAASEQRDAPGLLLIVAVVLDLGGSLGAA